MALKLLTRSSLLRFVIIGVFIGLIILSNKHETINQFYNAFWTLFCLCVQPALFWLMFLLIRWNPADARILRKRFCKNGTPKPNDRLHMAVVVLLYQLGVSGQYASCLLLWVYTKSKRPSTPLTVLNIATIVVGSLGKAYLTRGPLGRDDDQPPEVRTPMFVRKDNNNTIHGGGGGAAAAATSSMAADHIHDQKAEWQGGLFDLYGASSRERLSFCCPVCVFGWNMERIYLGNMYCQSATFFTFLAAPLLVFNMAAIHFHSHALKLAFLATSIVFCFLGLLYGAAWRIRMRRMYNLPGNDVCCGNPNVADGFQWLFCCCCSLAQEVRTADFYDVVVIVDGNNTNINPPPSNYQQSNGNYDNFQPRATPPSAPHYNYYHEDSNVISQHAPTSSNMQRGPM
ncbi:hypothetical protein Dimus_006930 [Dionaea muscipula]